MKRRLFEFSGKLPTYPNDATEAAFPLGGIGTGNVSVGARGELRDWELCNAPAKGNTLPYTFFAVRCALPDREPMCKVLEARLNPPFGEANGLDSAAVSGLPRFQCSRMMAEYPLVRVELADPDIPLGICLEAFTPLLPLEAADSGIPAAVLRYHICNRTDTPAQVAVAGSLANAAVFGAPGRMDEIGGHSYHLKNEYRAKEGLNGLFFTTEEAQDGDPDRGNLTLATCNPNVTWKRAWLQTGWYDGIQDFWDDFSADGRLEPEPSVQSTGSTIGLPGFTVGSLGIYETIAPGDTETFEFILSWSFPYRIRGWGRGDLPNGVIKNYYATRFCDSWYAARYLLAHMERLEDGTRLFQRVFYESTLPPAVLDRAGSSIAVLRSNTCFRTEDGAFYGWEGCMDREGSCHGSCTHVWNYAQTAAYLFPELERSMRRTEFLVETDESGRMAFRTQQTFGKKKWEMLPAADGQPGTVIRLYREWKLGGGDAFLRELWPKAAAALDFALDYWDKDSDGLPDAQQHNTYDIEFYGPNPLTGFILCAALKAGAEMAEHLGDEARAARYRTMFEKGVSSAEAHLWNGEYYEQKLDDPDAYRYQFGSGCLSDQLLGQFLAHMAGLGTILPKEHLQKAVKAVFRYNFISNFSDHCNVERTYALNEESGLVLCTWPHGGRPRFPFVYSDEVWTGVEYAVASELIFNGCTEEGLHIVRSVQDRYDGGKRNPWDEIECGHHYARSMASWGLILALSGFSLGKSDGTVRFAPVWSADDFSTFWSTGRAWGVFCQKKDETTGEVNRRIEVLYGVPGSVSLA